MQTMVPIVTRAEAKAVTGKEWNKAALVRCAVKVAASELLGRHVDELCNLRQIPLSGGDEFYAMPARERREIRAGALMRIQKISKRYVYVRTL